MSWFNSVRRNQWLLTPLLMTGGLTWWMLVPTTRASKPQGALPSWNLKIRGRLTGCSPDLKKQLVFCLNLPEIPLDLFFRYDQVHWLGSDEFWLEENLDLASPPRKFNLEVSGAKLSRRWTGLNLEASPEGWLESKVPPGRLLPRAESPPVPPPPANFPLLAARTPGRPQRTALVRRHRGLSLLESVIASFLLVSAFLVVTNLFHAGLGHSHSIEKQQTACLLANRYLEQMRLWSETRVAGTYNYETLAAVYDAHTETVRESNDYALTTWVRPLTICSPCSRFEVAIPALNATNGFPLGPRQLATTLNVTQAVELEVRWDGNQRFSLNSYICRPIPNPNRVQPVVITPQASTPYVVGGGVPLSHGDTGNGLNLTATVYNDLGQPLPGAFLEWTLVADSGDATLIQSRDGSVANLTNVVRPQGVPQFTGGNVTVVAQAKVHGVNITGRFGPIDLAP